MLASVVAAQGHVVDPADVHQLFATGVADRTLQVLLHLGQGVGQPALDGLRDALALDVLVLAFVEIAGRAVILFVQLALLTIVALTAMLGYSYFKRPRP